MATTVSTLAATAMVKADAAETVGAEAVSVTCACETTPAATVAPPVAEACEASEPEAEPLQEQRVTAPKPAQAKVEGALDKDIIRRIVKAHINEVRYCYNQGLADDPELAGRVEVAFTIGTDGRVSKSEVSSTTMGETEVPQCVAQAVERWMFPKPANDESVQVTYPFVLEPG